MASQITSLAIVYLTVYSGADQRKHQCSASLAFVRGIQPVTGEFPAQKASSAENISIWWRHPLMDIVVLVVCGVYAMVTANKKNVAYIVLHVYFGG